MLFRYQHFLVWKAIELSGSIYVVKANGFAFVRHF